MLVVHPAGLESPPRAAPHQQSSIKILLVGDAQVGKTSLAKRFVSGQPDLCPLPTIGLELERRVLTIDGQRTDVRIWDIGGHNRLREMAFDKLFVGACAIFIVFDLTSESSFDALRSGEWIERVAKRQESNSSGIYQKKHVVIVGTKADSILERMVESQRIELFASSVGLPYVETSAMTGDNIEELFVRVATNLQRERHSEEQLRTPAQQRRCAVM